MAQNSGVKFKFGDHVEQILTEGNKVTGVKIDGEILQADRYVVAMGSYSTSMLQSLVKIPVYPLKGYSLTMPIIDDQRSPTSTILDETYKIAVTRFDERIRVGGMAEVVGFNLNILKNAAKH